MSSSPECIKCGDYIHHGPVLCSDCLPGHINAELLEACEAALWRLEQYDYSAMQGTLDKVRAAIAKAKGE